MKKFSINKIFITFVLAILLFLSLVFLFVLSRYPLYYKASIKNYCQQYNLQPELIASIINTESSFDQNATSSKGAIGLMQIMPSTAFWICKKNQIELISTQQLYDPDTNIKIGCLYLSYLIDKFENIDNALYAYNAGEGTVKTWLLNKNYSSDGKTLNNIPYPETENYTKKIYNNLKLYKYLILI